MRKTECIEAIERLPLFELKDVAIDDSNVDDTEITWEKQLKDRAVVEIGNNESLAYVSTRYKLVQFKDVLGPVAEGIDSFSARLNTFKGVCVMDVFPNMSEFSNDDVKYGISVINSVDKSTSIVIKFNVKVNGQPLIFPSKLAGFVKSHTGKGFEITQNYIQVITKVKDAWGNIIKHFPEIEINDEDTLKMVVENFKINKDHKDRIELRMQMKQPLNLWDIVEIRLKEISKRNYKSEVHKSKALERLGNEIFSYAMVAGV